VEDEFTMLWLHQVNSRVAHRARVTPCSRASGEGMLELNERLLDALSSGANPPDAEEIEYMRAGLRRWQEQMTKLRQRMSSLTIEPPNRAQ
jgi:hypothetical protein